MVYTFYDKAKNVLESIYRVEYKMRFRHLYEDIICAELPGDNEKKRKNFAFERISKYLRRESSCQFLKLPSHPHQKWRCRRNGKTIDGIDPRPYCWNCPNVHPLDPIKYGKITRGHRWKMIEDRLPGCHKYMINRVRFQLSHGNKCPKIRLQRPQWWMIRLLENLPQESTDVDLTSCPELHSSFEISSENNSVSAAATEGGIPAI